MHTIAEGTPATPEPVHVAGHAEALHAHYWFRRAYQRSLGKCYCGAPLDPERIREKRLCSSCEAADTQRIERLERSGLNPPAGAAGCG